MKSSYDTDEPDQPEPEAIFDATGALTREFLLSRGGCCGNKCRNCPYDWVGVVGDE